MIGVGIPSPSIPLFCPGFPVALVGVEELRARHFVIVLGTLAMETTGFAGTSTQDLGNRDVKEIYLHAVLPQISHTDGSQPLFFFLRGA